MRPFVVSVILVAAACGPRGAIQITTPDKYEVGEDPIIDVVAPQADASSPLQATIVVKRPDGTEQKESAKLVNAKTRVRLSTAKQGEPPTFTQIGLYIVELRSDGEPLAPPLEINVAKDHLTELLAESIAEYKAKIRYTRARSAGELRWKLYGGIYEHPWQKGHEIEVIIEEPGDSYKRAWAPYVEAGTLEVVQNNYVRLRERVGSATASWTARGRIISLKSSSLAKLDPKFVGRFLARHPSDLKAK